MQTEIVGMAMHISRTPFSGSANNGHLPDNPPQGKNISVQMNSPGLSPGRRLKEPYRSILIRAGSQPPAPLHSDPAPECAE